MAEAETFSAVMAAGSPPAPLRRRLPDGSPILLRPVDATDKPLLQMGMALLSRDTIYARFHGARGRFTEAELRYLTEIDYRNHMAWLAIDLRGGAREAFAIGRYVRAAGSKCQAEVAITVCDRHQGRGVGRLLLTELARVALKNHIERFRARIVAGNLGALSLVRRAGARISPADAGTRTMVATLDLASQH